MIVMEKMKLALGTASEQKRRYLEEVLTEMGIEADIFPFQVESGISEQPMTSDETKQGSVNRAAAALAADDGSDCALGIEVGYHPVEDDKYEIFCWATVTDRAGSCISQRSHGFIMPEFHQEKMRQGLNLGDHVKEYFKMDADPVVQYVAEMIRGRKPFITNAIKYALIFYLRKGEY